MREQSLFLAAERYFSVCMHVAWTEFLRVVSAGKFDARTYIRAKYRERESMAGEFSEFAGARERKVGASNATVSLQRARARSRRVIQIYIPNFQRSFPRADLNYVNDNAQHNYALAYAHAHKRRRAQPARTSRRNFNDLNGHLDN